MAYTKIIASITFDNPKADITANIPVAAISYFDIKVDVKLDFRGLNPSFLLSFAVTESLVSSFSKALADTSTITEDHAIAFTKSFSDTVTATDDFLGEANVDDDQNMLFSKVTSDTYSASDTINSLSVAKVLTETSNATESLIHSLTKVASDSFSTSDSPVFNTGKSATDTASTGESVVNLVSKVATDSATITDTGTVTIQDYIDSTYFAEDYVGTSSSFT